MTAATSERLIALEIAYNVRHIGGYEAGTKRTTSRLIRAGSLHRLTGESIDRLRLLDVKMVVDFRSEKELERNPTPDLSAAGVVVRHAPVFTSDASPVGLGDRFPGFGPIYERFLESGVPAYRALAEAIIESDGAVVFHCSAGKDRTGVAGALLLGLAGVNDATIVADYAETHQHLSPEFPNWIKDMQARDIPEDMAQKLLASDPKAIEHALGIVQKRWGGAAGYFEWAGLSSSQVDALRDRLFE